MTFSAGIASSDAGEPLALKELWERSDAALYEPKRLGRRQSVSFKSMAEDHTVSAEKIIELTTFASGSEPLSVAFQPIWDLRRRVVLAHEALMRLPKGSRINGPQEAFELAERLGVAAALDARARSAVLAEVCSRQWEGLLFLNVHPDALPGFDLDNLIAELAVAGLGPGDVVLEVTEQAALNHADPSSMATVAAAITFIQESGGWVVAEGVEEPQTLAWLLRPGPAGAARQPVTAGQGYLLGRPD